MAGFELYHKETTSENIQRLLNGQLDNILEHCEADPEHIHRSVHEIRKSFKRIRAILRLVRDEIGYSSYYRENTFYRDLSRKLSDIRSFNVLIDTTRKLQSELSNTIPEAGIAPLVESLQARRDTFIEMILLEENIMGHISNQLEKGKKRVPDLLIQHDDFRAFRGGLLRIYRQGMRYRDLARMEPSFHNLHDLRKRLKYLWYQMIILQPIFPSMLKAYSETLDIIGDNLGVYHDFAELQQFLELNSGILHDTYQAAMTEGCEFKMASILNRTWSYIDTIYSEEPAKITHRFTHYWQAYKNENSADIKNSI